MAKVACFMLILLSLSTALTIGWISTISYFYSNWTSASLVGNDIEGWFSFFIVDLLRSSLDYFDYFE